MKYVMTFESFKESFWLDNPMLVSYLETALWSDERLDEYNIRDIDDKSVEDAKKDCDDFITKAGELIEGEDLKDIGHDFWLTRNGHGAGFWDGDYDEDKGQKLTKIAKEFGEKFIEESEGTIFIS